MASSLMRAASILQFMAAWTELPADNSWKSRHFHHVECILPVLLVFSSSDAIKSLSHPTLHLDNPTQAS
jgi:hypothetical protein